MRGRFDFFPAITLIQWNGKLIFAFQMNFSPIICDRNSITSALRQVWTLRLDFNPIKESFYKSTFLSDVIHCIVDHSDAEFALKKKFILFQLLKIDEISSHLVKCGCCWGGGGGGGGRKGGGGEGRKVVGGVCLYAFSSLNPLCNKNSYCQSILSIAVSKIIILDIRVVPIILFFLFLIPNLSLTLSLNPPT